MLTTNFLPTDNYRTLQRLNAFLYTFLKNCQNSIKNDRSAKKKWGCTNENIESILREGQACEECVGGLAVLRPVHNSIDKSGGPSALLLPARFAPDFLSALCLHWLIICAELVSRWLTSLVVKCFVPLCGSMNLLWVQATFWSVQTRLKQNANPRVSRGSMKFLKTGTQKWRFTIHTKRQST